MTRSAGANLTTPTYDPDFFPTLCAVEDRHFWFRTRNRVIEAQVGQIVAPLPAGFRVLEVGCGTGNTLRVLEAVCARGLVVGVDLYQEGLDLARRRVSCPLVRADVFRLPFQPCFDLICLFDVLEHLPDDVRVLRALSALLVPTGKLLLTVPASRSLWSYFDVAAHHCRRYEKTDLQAALHEAGFQVEFLSPFMMALYPILWLGRRLTGFGKAADARQAAERSQQDLRIGAVSNKILTSLVAWELPFIKARRKLPLGSSLVALASKSSIPPECKISS